MIGKGKGGRKGQPGPAKTGAKTGAGGGGKGGAGGGKGGSGAKDTGGPKGGAGGARPPAPPEFLQNNFDSGCRYCGGPDHRRADCPKLTEALKARGLRAVGGAEAADADDWWLTSLTDDLEDGAAPGGERPLACLMRPPSRSSAPPSPVPPPPPPHPATRPA